MVTFTAFRRALGGELVSQQILICSALSYILPKKILDNTDRISVRKFPHHSESPQKIHHIAIFSQEEVLRWNLPEHLQHRVVRKRSKSKVLGRQQINSARKISGTRIISSTALRPMTVLRERLQSAWACIASGFMRYKTRCSNSDRMDMKTNSLISIFFALLLCFGADLSKAALGDCICPTEVVTQTQVHATISNIFQDLCAHCGHTSNCCFSKADVPVIGSLHLSQVELDNDLALCAPVPYDSSSVCSTVLSQSGVNKAPPQASRPTLLSLNQELLI